MTAHEIATLRARFRQKTEANAAQPNGNQILCLLNELDAQRHRNLAQKLAAGKLLFSICEVKTRNP